MQKFFFDWIHHDFALSKRAHLKAIKIPLNLLLIGVISINLGGIVIIFINTGGKKKQAALLDMDVVAEVKLSLVVRFLQTKCSTL